MSEPMTDRLQTIATAITSKRSRSLLFLIVTFVAILAINGLLPIVSGKVHYTAESVEYTYGEYLALKKSNEMYDLTYASRTLIKLYEYNYIKANPDLTPEELVTIEPPADLRVNVYTKFFFQSPWWYVSMIISMLSAVFLFYAVFNYLLVRSKDTRIEHINGESKIKQLNEKYLDPDTFEPWLEDDFNRSRKVKQHIRNVKHKLKRLETKTPYTIRKRFKHYFDTKQSDQVFDTLLPVPYIELTRKERTYLDTKEELLDQLSDNYIQEYAIHSNVKNYKEIKAGFIYSGVNSNNVLSDEYSTIKTDTKRIKETVMSRALVALAVTFAFASLFTVVGADIESQSPFWIVVTIITKVVPLLMQIYFSINYTNWFMENQLLPNLSYREKIAYMYLAEMQRRGVVTQNINLEVISLGGDPNA